MTIHNPDSVPLHIWQRTLALMVFVGYPLAGLSVVLVLPTMPVLSPASIALALAALGTTWRIWADAKQLGNRMASLPERRSEILKDFGTGFYAWGIVCLAAWMGFFSQVIS